MAEGRKIIRKNPSEKEESGQLKKRVFNYQKKCQEFEAEHFKLKARSAETINLLKKSASDLSEAIIVCKKIVSYSETSLFQEEKKNMVKFCSGSGMVVSRTFLNFYLITNVERYFFDSYRIF